jgi:propionyl-CoA carboxylase alpha chain
MICKLIACGSDRAAAIATLREALNGFVIRGVASNLAFQGALLAHPRFVSGEFTTAFIAEEYANGFVSPPPGAERDLLVALAAAFNRRLLARAAGLSGQLPGHEVETGADFVVVEQGPAGAATQTPVRITVEGDDHVVTVGGRVRRISFATPLREIAARGWIDGQAFHAQIERVGLGLRVARNGSQIEVRVLSPRAAELHALMPYKPPPDLSGFLLSPMPGLLVSVAVAPGQAVRAGERLAVIEAMKMENVVVAGHDGVVARVVARPGDSVAVDEVILEFEARA